MKLSRVNKHQLQAGAVLIFPNGEKFRVLSVHAGADMVGAAGAVSVTVICPDGRTLYGAPCSMFYGAEILP